MRSVNPSSSKFFDFAAFHVVEPRVADLKRSILIAARGQVDGVLAPGVIATLRSVVLEAVRSGGVDITTPSSKWIDTIEDFLTHLEDSSCTEETLHELWLTLPLSIKSLLARFDEGHPREILHWIDEQGNNQLEQLLEALYRLRDHKGKEEELLIKVQQRLKPCERRVDSETSLGTLYHSLSAVMLGLSPEDIGKIPDERLRVAIVKQLSPSCVSEEILEYGIKSQGGLIEVAMHFAKLEGWTVSENIHKYGIVSAKARLEILKVVIASDNSGSVFHNIGNYEIVDQGSRLEVLKLLVDSRYCDDVPIYIDRYGIEAIDEETRIDLAKRLAVNTRTLSTHIRKFRIGSESVRIEIAELVAVHKFSEMALEAIECYEISDEDARVRIAALVAERRGAVASLFIGQARISSEEARVMIAMLAIKRCAWHE